jgi:uncharacterized membrane protein YdbT with pleckstrin-like domain
MRYIQSSLLKTEKIVYASRPHWIVFAPSVAAFLFAFLIWVYLPQYIGYYPPIWRGWHVHELLAAAVGLFALYSLCQTFVYYSTSEYGITDKRIIMKHGWIQRESAEIFLQRVEAINVNQTVVGRILNYGTVVVVGTGGSTDFYSYIPDPVGFRRIVQQQMDLLIDPK